MRRHFKLLALGVGLLAIAAGRPDVLLAQGKSKHYAVTTDRAISVTREVLVQHGYAVVRIETEGDAQVVYYRRGNNGRGKGKGRLEKMVIRREKDRVVFGDTPSAILVDIDVRLKL